MRRRDLLGAAGAAFGLTDVQAQAVVPSAGVLARRKGIRLGMAIASHALRIDTALAALVRQHGLGLVPEWEMKWHALWPAPERRHAAAVDALASDASARGVSMRGHTLIWHASLPEWALLAMREGRAAQLMSEHIAWVGARYADRIDSWDVVNEAIWPAHGLADGLRRSPWLDALGAGYIERAFREARAALPKARLVYNDYDIEHDALKAEAVLNLVRTHRNRGVPIDAVGLQSHLWASRRRVNVPVLTRFCRECRREGIDVVITELDVRESEFDGAPAQRDQRSAEVVERYLAAVLAEVTPKEIFFWGLTDRYSWLSSPKYNPENPRGLLNRGLPFDEDLRPKPMWHALLSALAGLNDAR